MQHLIIIIYANFIQYIRSFLLLSTTSMKILYIPGFSSIRSFNAKVRAYHEFVKAKKQVPGYRAFLKANKFNSPTFNWLVPNIQDIPFTDKENYVKIYSMDERCIAGKIPSKGVVIDESSGSTGTATNWVRGPKERKVNAKFIKFGIHNHFGKDPLFIINAFALGPWATGVNITMSCVNFSKLKSLGPDKIKIENTLRHFGKNHKYIIMGYPPFLKQLVENTEINWNDFDISFVFGGESMSEGMRDYLLSKGIKKVISSLGASDLELNISAENDFTISLRRLIQNNPMLQKHLLKFSGALPMIFQYNPSDFLIESSSIGELIITIGRPHYIAPKIRYNIHDRGHILEVKELFSLLESLKISPSELSPPQTDLPLLFHYGRSDMTVSFFGANISPTDVQEAMYQLDYLVSTVNSFCLNVSEDFEGNKKLTVFFELNGGKETKNLISKQVHLEFFNQLAKVNQDFKEAKRMLNSPDQLQIQFEEFSQGIFKNSDIRIKSRYIN